MRARPRSLIVLAAVLWCSSAYVFTATQNVLPKYGPGGNSYVDSVISDVSGNVGIGTTTPSSKLHLWAPSYPQAIEISNSGGNSFKMLYTYTPGSGYRVSQGFGGTETLVLTETARIGIGTTTPASKLHVVGDVTVDGNIGAKYQDVAEWVQADENLRPGTVVVVADPDEANSVRASNAAYDTAVAGVVSARPGILLGERGAGKVAVAQSGRVKVKVDASYGPIKAGDLLVTSATEGYARRSDPLDIAGVPLHRPGTILGKALEPLPAGRGEVLTLLTLQ